MPIPPFNSYFLPMLEEFGSGQELSLRQLRARMQKKLQLSDKDLLERTRMGTELRHNNRTRSSVIRLVDAGLINRREAGIFRISEKGKNLLNQNRTSLTLGDLRILGTEHNVHTQSERAESTEEELTPIENLNANHEQLTNELASELLAEVKGIDPNFFEKLVVDLLEKMGYGGELQNKGIVTGGSGDGGVDGIIDQDALGLEKVYIQAKHHRNTVPVSAVREFLGALTVRHASRGVFFTISKFSKQGIQEVKESGKNVVLVDGNKLARLMITHKLGVSEVKTISLCKLDNDYFDEIRESRN